MTNIDLHMGGCRWTKTFYFCHLQLALINTFEMKHLQLLVHFSIGWNWIKVYALIAPGHAFMWPRQPTFSPARE